jgi:hypothetical protein
MRLENIGMICLLTWNDVSTVPSRRCVHAGLQQRFAERGGYSSLLNLL